MARAVSSGFYQSLVLPPVPMPEFKNSKAKVAYYGANPDRSQFDDVHKASWSSKEGNKFIHQPRHDVESIYWVIVAFMLRSIPPFAAEEEEDNIKAYSEYYKLLVEHRANSHPLALDARITFFTSVSDHKWKLILHPRFEDISGMMAALTSLIAPEYENLDTELPQDHLHEGMQRILLDEIMRMDESGDHMPISPNEREYRPSREQDWGAGETQSHHTSHIPRSSASSGRRKRHIEAVSDAVQGPDHPSKCESPRNRAHFSRLITFLISSKGGLAHTPATRPHDPVID